MIARYDSDAQPPYRASLSHKIVTDTMLMGYTACGPLLAQLDGRLS
jgi:hypothetical protein